MKSRKRYVLASGLTALIFFLTSLPYLFKNYIAIPVLNIYIDEIYIYAFCIVFFPLISIVAALLTHKQASYDYMDVIINCVIAFTSAMLLKCVDFSPVIILIAVGFFVVSSIVFFICKRKEEGFTFRKWISKLRYLFALVFAVIMIPVFIHYVLIITDQNIKPIEEELPNEDNQTMAEIFSEENWSGLTVEEKFAAVNSGIKYLINELRIEKIEVRVNDTSLKDSLHASYSHSQGCIEVSENYILTCDDPKQIFRTLCHECYHCYQYNMMDLYFKIADSDISVSAPYFDTIRRWVAGHNSYVEDKEVYENYINNPLEADANAYADEKIAEIFGIE
ncbi:MAG: hypothetical protein E7266_03245 [Lachnospiraceae bacterium]|nr:hypothetical protein [Lachnospiraceae bacterium]